MDLGVRSFVGERSADSDARTVLVQRSWNSPTDLFISCFLSDTNGGHPRSAFPRSSPMSYPLAVHVS